MVQPPPICYKGKENCYSHERRYRPLVLEGVEILNSVNYDLDLTRKTFEPIGGDPKCTDLKSFWWKTKCVYCSDVFNLCPPKNNLEANLKNHAQGTMHAKKVVEPMNAKNKPLLSGKEGGLRD